MFTYTTILIVLTIITISPPLFFLTLLLLRQAGQRANSSAVMANAWQHRADVSTSSAVFLGLLGGMAGYPMLDPFAGMIVALVVMRQVSVWRYD
ncbi:hypothetical protein EON63_23285 [archaeon]|nr:MAG: hypothetical protein EON63_23285 [archaeon]